MTKERAAFTSAAITEGWTEPQIIRETESGESLKKPPTKFSFSHWPISPGSTTPPFVIPTGAKRSGGICGAPFPNATAHVEVLLTPEAAVKGAVLDGFGNVAYGNLWLCVEICDGARDFQYPVVGARAQTLLLHGAFKQPFRLR
jgi:hypothetical protein